MTAATAYSPIKAVIYALCMVLCAGCATHRSRPVTKVQPGEWVVIETRAVFEAKIVWNGIPAKGANPNTLTPGEAAEIGVAATIAAPVLVLLAPLYIAAGAVSLVANRDQGRKPTEEELAEADSKATLFRRAAEERGFRQQMLDELGARVQQELHARGIRTIAAEGKTAGGDTAPRQDLDVRLTVVEYSGGPQQGQIRLCAYASLPAGRQALYDEQSYSEAACIDTDKSEGDSPVSAALRAADVDKLRSMILRLVHVAAETIAKQVPATSK